MHEIEAKVLKAAYAYAEALSQLYAVLPVRPDATKRYRATQSFLAFAAADLIDIPLAQRSVDTETPNGDR